MEGRVGRESVKSIHLIQCEKGGDTPSERGATHPKEGVTNGLETTAAASIAASAADIGTSGSTVSNGCLSLPNGHHKAKGSSKSKGACNGVSRPPHRSPLPCNESNLAVLERLTPVIVMGSGEVFGRCSQLESWLQLGECGAVRRVLMAQYTCLPPPSSVGSSANAPLAALLRHTSA